ncbi:MAG: type 4a pilus biogenesis protein PilO [Candidatus Omnitrophica bacterium]|nr:type 4a pilus biogenesis protein PilO [Candidatus Omnitrophota bacterium]
MFSPDLIDRYKSNIANLVVVIIFVFISINLYKTQAKNMAALKERKDTEAKKNRVLENLSQLQTKIDELTNLVNTKDLYQTISSLNNMARESAVKIISIKPLGQQDFPAYVKYPFEMTVEAGNYHQIGKFISNIESNPNVYTIESLNMHTAQNKQDGNVEAISASLRVDTVLFKVK